MNTASTRPSPRNLPRNGAHSDPGIASVISPSPASRSRQTSSPAKKTMSSGTITQRLSSARQRGCQFVEDARGRGDQRDAAWLPSDRAPRAPSAAGWRPAGRVRPSSSRSSGTSPTRWRASDARGWRSRTSAGPAGRRSACSPRRRCRPASGTCASRRRVLRLHQVALGAMGEAKAQVGDRERPSAMPSHRRRFVSTVPSSAIRRTFFSIVVHECDRSSHDEADADRIQQRPQAPLEEQDDGDEEAP